MTSSSQRQRHYKRVVMVVTTDTITYPAVGLVYRDATQQIAAVIPSGEEFVWALNCRAPNRQRVKRLPTNGRVTD